jgi:hypothetical protein
LTSFSSTLTSAMISLMSGRDLPPRDAPSSAS